MIKNAMEHELNECCEIMRISYKEAASKAGFPNRGRVDFTYNELLAEVKAGDRIFINQAEGTSVAMMRIKSFENKTWRIKDIAVLPEYQRGGYGKELLDFIKLEASNNGIEKIELGMFDDELILKRWYEKNEFSSVKTVPFSNTPFVIRIMEYHVGVLQ